MPRFRPPSIPPGLRVRCARAQIRPGMIDRDHAAFAERCKLPNRPEAEAQLLLLPEPVRDAVLRWTGGGSEARP